MKTSTFASAIAALAEPKANRTPAGVGVKPGVPDRVVCFGAGVRPGNAGFELVDGGIVPTVDASPCGPVVRAGYSDWSVRCSGLETRAA